jgi:uncharacterized protein YkwD
MGRGGAAAARLVIAATLLLPAAIARPPGACSQERAPQLADYQAANERETRCLDDKDGDAMLQAKLEELRVINADRLSNGAPAVALDILASRVANRMAREACEGNFSGHWNMRGEKPYYRYAAAGGVDHVSENAAAYWTSGTISRDEGNCFKLMRESHERFMAERPPADGHRTNCLEKCHNFVGLGAFILGGQFRYYEEYIDRYLEFANAPAELARDQKAVLSVRPRDPATCIYAVVIYREPLPRPMSAAEINGKGGYPDYTNEQVRSIWPWELQKMTVGGLLNLETGFSREGLYYVQIFLSDTPYTNGSASTSGKVQASGLVVRVR